VLWPGFGELSWRSGLAIGLVLLGAGVLAWRFKGWRKWLSEWRAAGLDTEESDFRAVRAACINGSTSAAYQAAACWVRRIAPQYVSLTAFARANGHLALEFELIQMQRALIEVNKPVWSGSTLLALLSDLRKQMVGQHATSSPNQLPTLNPTA
jgi:hypothetical protein